MGDGLGWSRGPVPRIEIEEVLDHPKKSTDRHIDMCLLKHLSSECLRRGLSDFEVATRKGPEVFIDASMKQNAVFVFGDTSNTAEKHRVTVSQLRVSHTDPWSREDPRLEGTERDVLLGLRRRELLLGTS